VYLVLQSPQDAWLRSGPVASFLWNLDSLLPPATWDWSVQGRVAYLAVAVAVVFLVIGMMLQRLYLRFLLHYTGWLFENKWVVILGWFPKTPPNPRGFAGRR
jgi:hypothetical protein